MTDKPSFLGLLNAVAVAEGKAAQYLCCWEQVTPNDDVRALLRTVRLREAEHALAFEKRIDELGFCVQDRADADHDRRMAIAASTSLSDREKLEQLELCRRPENGRSDVFDRFFENKDIDPVTGGLLGRYIAEERDTGRRFADCHAALCAAEKASAQNFSAQSNGGQSNGGQRNGSVDLGAVADQVAAAGRQLADLVRAVADGLAGKN